MEWPCTVSLTSRQAEQICSTAVGKATGSVVWGCSVFNTDAILYWPRGRAEAEIGNNLSERNLDKEEYHSKGETNWPCPSAKDGTAAGNMLSPFLPERTLCSKGQFQKQEGENTLTREQESWTAIEARTPAREDQPGPNKIEVDVVHCFILSQKKWSPPLPFPSTLLPLSVFLVIWKMGLKTCTN